MRRKPIPRTESPIFLGLVCHYQPTPWYTHPKSPPHSFHLLFYYLFQQYSLINTKSKNPIKEKPLISLTKKKGACEMVLGRWEQVEGKGLPRASHPCARENRVHVREREREGVRGASLELSLDWFVRFEHISLCPSLGSPGDTEVRRVARETKSPGRSLLALPSPLFPLCFDLRLRGIHLSPPPPQWLFRPSTRPTFCF